MAARPGAESIPRIVAPARKYGTEVGGTSNKWGGFHRNGANAKIEDFSANRATMGIYSVVAKHMTRSTSDCDVALWP